MHANTACKLTGNVYMQIMRHAFTESRPSLELCPLVFAVRASLYALLIAFHARRVTLRPKFYKIFAYLITTLLFAKCV